MNRWLSLGASAALLSVAIAAFANRPHAYFARVGVNQSPPYSLIGTDGTPHGFSVEVLMEAARRRDIELQWVNAKEGPDIALANGKVDIWPLVTDIPARHGHILFTDPYLRTRFALLIARGGQIHKQADSAGRRVSHADTVIAAQLAAQFFSHSTLIPSPPGEEMKVICQGRADAALVEVKVMLNGLLVRSPECRTMALDLLPIEGASFDMGIGSNRRGEEVAKALRAEITSLSRDGTLNDLYRKWLRDTTDETRIVNDLTAAKQRSRLLCWGAGLLAFIIFLLGWIMYRKGLARKASKSAYEFASAALDSAGGLVLICNSRGEILQFNRACERASGKTLIEVCGKTLWDVLVPPDEKASVQAMFANLARTGHATGDHHWQTADGCRLYSWSNTTLVNQKGKIDYIIATGIDITAREEAEERLGHEARHDPLTNLANRRHFLGELERAAARAREDNVGFAVAMADLDKFKLINDTYGHAAGDTVLVFFARLIREELHAVDDLGGRIGGDEFSLLLRGSSARNKIERIGKRLSEKIFYVEAGATFRAGVTFGLAVWSNAMDCPGDLLRAADESLYIAKRNNFTTLSSFPRDRIALSVDAIDLETVEH